MKPRSALMRIRNIACTVVLLAVAVIGRAQSPARDITPPRAATLSIRGRVVAAGTDAPLRSARVQATAANQAAAPAFTDAEGRFALPIPADGSSGLSVTKPGYLATAFEAPRTEGELDLRLPKASAIAGRITDTSGDPVMGMTVTAEIPGTAASGSRVVATCQTDDLGDYRLGGLPEGRYLVSVNSIAPAIGEGGTIVNELKDGSRTAAVIGRVPDEVRRQIQMRVYFPGVQGRGDLLLVALTAGEERSAMDFSVPARQLVDLRGGAGSSVGPRGAARWLGTGLIRGRVVATDGRAVPHAIVRMEVDTEGSDVFPVAVTDEQGRYEFRQLGARRYTMTATRAGFLTMSHGQRRPADGAAPIELQSGETRDNVDITLSRPSTITGRVVDEAGEPVEGADVRLLHIQFRDGRRRLVDAGGQGTRRTDDRGAYRVYGLPPGEYIVSAHVSQVVPGHAVFDLPGLTPSYAPGTASPGEARRISVDLGQEVSGVEVALARAPTAAISGTVVDAAGRPADRGLILTPSRRSGALAADAIDARIDPDGRFAFPNVTPGEYVIQASRGGDGPNDEGESASQFVTVGNTDVTGLTVQLSRGSTLKGRITFEGNPSPEAYFSLDLQAVPVDTDRTPQNLEAPASARIRPDGSFDMAGLSGPRVLRLSEGASDWTLKSVRLDGREITDTPLTFGAANQSIDGLEVILTDRVSVVMGHVLDGRGRGVADATAVVFPIDRTLWGPASRFVASVRTARDGAFSIRNLPPGYYHAAAATQVAPGEWQDADLLDALAAIATPLTIVEGDAVTATLRAVTR
jgi:protocatechuate 3,4-dioxygenase beta subunit